MSTPRESCGSVERLLLLRLSWSLKSQTQNIMTIAGDELRAIIGQPCNMQPHATCNMLATHFYWETPRKRAGRGGLVLGRLLLIAELLYFVSHFLLPGHFCCALLVGGGGWA